LAEKKKAENATKTDDNVIFVGKKPAMSYVLAVMTQFTGGAKEVQIKARGKSISRAVDVAEIVKNKFLGDVKVKNIEIGTEERAVDGGNKVNVSTLSIVLAKS
jgi:DNA-binding protein Alba